MHVHSISPRVPNRCDFATPAPRPHPGDMWQPMGTFFVITDEEGAPMTSRDAAKHRTVDRTAPSTENVRTQKPPQCPPQSLRSNQAKSDVPLAPRRTGVPSTPRSTRRVLSTLLLLPGAQTTGSSLALGKCHRDRTGGQQGSPALLPNPTSSLSCQGTTANCALPQPPKLSRQCYRQH